MAAFPLSRFIAAQDRDGTYAAALEELRAGRKRSHWMWFVFPQIAGLGHSPMSRTYDAGPGWAGTPAPASAPRTAPPCWPRSDPRSG